MFNRIVEAIKSLFSTLFGGGSETDASSPNVNEDNPPQDAVEMPKDTVIIVTDEAEASDLRPVEEEAFLDEVTPETETPTEPEQPTEETPTHKQRYLWCLDNGHGSETPGKRSPVFEFNGESGRLFEYEFNRDIVARIIKRLDKEGVAYFNVVPEVEIGDFLSGRVDRANNKESDLPKLYVSIHSNASRAKDMNSWGADSARGIETWHHANSSKGTKMAAIFQRKLIEKTGFFNRHLKTTNQLNLFVLRKTIMPAVLTENGFYNNRFEAVELMKDEVRQQIADAHVEAILEIEQNGL